MKNFSIKIDNKEYWISRSTCVVAFIYRQDDQGNYNILLTKRGSGCPDEVGKYCCPCGYIDYDETVKSAVVREVFEETGLTLNESHYKFVGYGDDLDGKQNISFRFVADVTKVNPKFLQTTNKHSEPNEVDEIVWIPIAKLPEFDLAFNHKELIIKYLPE